MLTVRMLDAIQSAIKALPSESVTLDHRRAAYWVEEHRVRLHRDAARVLAGRDDDD